jgi:hypothetical protein
MMGCGCHTSILYAYMKSGIMKHIQIIYIEWRRKRKSAREDEFNKGIECMEISQYCFVQLTYNNK